MITSKTKKVILKAIGKKHISKIASFAKDQGVTKEDGAEYSNSTFSHVLNGRLEHAEIESLILTCAENSLAERNLHQKRINDLENNLKTSA